MTIGMRLVPLAVTLAFAQGASGKKTFETPEAAVRHFVTAVAADDLDGALQAFAIDDFGAGYDFTKWAHALGTFSTISMKAPAAGRSRFTEATRTACAPPTPT